jgi:hypothetical protein
MVADLTILLSPFLVLMYTVTLITNYMFHIQGLEENQSTRAVNLGKGKSACFPEFNPLVLGQTSHVKTGVRRGGWGWRGRGEGGGGRGRGEGGGVKLQ